ncbi:MAG: two-component system alkaline phosphatase synthesis response regulator PhoP [Rhodothermales bacterium]|jgi:two-component system alkaline phosphatase synthesis response regulator PhoP
MPKKRIVVVEDEGDILEVLSYNLMREGYDVFAASDGVEGLQKIQQILPDLVLLDLMLPGMDGLEICRQMRSSDQTQNIPIIMVTAKGEESDVVLGLGIGADDYVAKPFSPKELIARVSAVLRRQTNVNPYSKNERIIVNDLEIDALKHKVRVDGIEVQLTATEFRLLHYLASQPGRAFTREQLLDRSLGNDTEVVDRNIDVHIRAIRKKLGEERHFIETIRGVGYRFVEPDSRN